MPSAGRVVGATTNGKIYVSPYDTAAVWEFDPYTFDWRQMNPMQTARAAECMAAVSDSLFVMGGWARLSSGGVLIIPSLEEGILESMTMLVDVDIKPQSCPNPINIESKGVKMTYPTFTSQP